VAPRATIVASASRLLLMRDGRRVIAGLPLPGLPVSVDGTGGSDGSRGRLVPDLSELTLVKPTIDRLFVGDEPAAWKAAGFAVDDDGTCRIGTVRIALGGRDSGKGMRRWSLRGIDPVDEIDGIPTGSSDEPPVEPAEHPNGVRRIDHLVLASGDGERTAAAITAATGLEVLRLRESGTYGAPMHQRFIRLGEVLLELISPAEAIEAPTRFYGLAVDVQDIDSLPAYYGEHIGAVKDAVQPGRRIATLRHKDLDMSVAIAFMSPGAASA
jgi:hypothetical protein